ncbi:unnamed protein product, partial [marine sediment metagenome]
ETLALLLGGRSKLCLRVSQLQPDPLNTELLIAGYLYPEITALCSE